MSDSSLSKRLIAALRRWAAPIVAALVLTLYYFSIARHIAPSGDEVSYLKGALLVRELISQAIQMDWAAASETLDLIVGRGWFMPGMSVVLAPASLLTEETAELRIYIGVLNLSLVCLILKFLRDGFGPLAQTIFLCLTLTLPYYGMFSFLFWGDLLTAQFALLIGLFLIKQIEACGGQGIPIRVGAMLGLALTVATYLRGSYWLCLPLLLGSIFFSSFSLPSITSRFRHLLLVGGTCSLVFVLLLAPWSILVSQRHGAHITTTSTAMSQIIAFGSEDYLDSIERRRRSNIFKAVEENIRNLAEDAGVSYSDQARVELGRATADLTLEDYARRVGPNLGAFFLDSELIIRRFRKGSSTSETRSHSDSHERLFDVAETLNYWVWRFLLVCGILLFLVPVELDRRSLTLSWLFKYMVFFYTLQPLAVLVHGRYYIQYVPYIAVAVAIVISNRRRVWSTRGPSNVDEWIILVGQGFALAFGTAVLATAALLG